MPKLSLWNGGRKGNDFRFLDRQIAEYFQIGGTALYVHRYLGVRAEDGTPLEGAKHIQDMLFLENRDRVYDQDIIELRGIYSLGDADFDLRSIGIFLTNDDIYVEVHMADSTRELGRKFMSGDVIEFPHLRDYDIDPDQPPANKFYVVSDVNRASAGYSQTWFPHVLRLKCSPMPSSQEYESITSKKAKDFFGMETGSTILDILGTNKKNEEINTAVVEEAKSHMTYRNFETRQFYYDPSKESTTSHPWVYASDGIPPNGAIPIGAGSSYPENPKDGDYFLRTDYSPNMLFKRIKNTWRRQEMNLRDEWSMANRVTDSFVNNEATEVHDDGTVRKQKTALSKAILPGVDF